MPFDADTASLPSRAHALLDFWFGTSEQPERFHHKQIWFRSTREFDEAVRTHFAADHELAKQFFQRAIALDASFVAPYAALAQAYLDDGPGYAAGRGSAGAGACWGRSCSTAQEVIRCRSTELPPRCRSRWS